ncbi:MAG: hypothetical protein ACRDRM_01160, partial [Pseudonocardiaceae bacterium]
MTGSALSMLLMAAALVVVPGPAGPRSRLGRPAAQVQLDQIPARWLGPVARLSPRTRADDEPLALAAAWDLLAACLRAGMAVPLAVRAVAD